MFLVWYDEVVAFDVNLHAESSKRLGNDAEVWHRDVFYPYPVTHHGSHADKRSHLNHVGQDAVCCAVQCLYTLDGEQVAGYAAYLCPHAIQHLA